MRRENGERNKRFLFQHRLTLSLFCYARYILDGYFLNVFLCVCLCGGSTTISCLSQLCCIFYACISYKLSSRFQKCHVIEFVSEIHFSIIQTVHFDKINGNSINIDYLNV